MTTKQHVQLPNNMTKSGELSPKDLLVYVTIKSFMNKDSKECFPSIETIVERSGVSKPTVRKAIEALKREEYITVRTEGRRNIYKFSPYKTFEPFSYDFVKDKTIDANLKAYIIATQQLMFKDVNGYGKISYSDIELANQINLDKRTVAKYNKELEDKGYLTLVPTNKKEFDSGLQITEKIFHLDKLGQSIIWALNKHEEDIDTLKEKSLSTDKDISLLIREINSIKNSMEDLEREKDIILEMLGKDISISEEIERKKNKEIIL